MYSKEPEGSTRDRVVTNTPPLCAIDHTESIRKNLSAQLNTAALEEQSDFESDEGEMEEQSSPETDSHTHDGALSPLHEGENMESDASDSPYIQRRSHNSTPTPAHESISGTDSSTTHTNNSTPQSEREKLDLGFLWAQDRDRFLANRAQQQRDMQQCHNTEKHDLRMSQQAELAHWRNYFAHTIAEAHAYTQQQSLNVQESVQAQYMHDMRLRHQSELDRVNAHHKGEVIQWRKYFDGVLWRMEDEIEAACEHIVELTASGNNNTDFIVKCGDCQSTLASDDYFRCQGCKMATCASCKGAACDTCEEELCLGCLGSWEKGCDTCAVSDIVRCCQLNTMPCGKQECAEHTAQHERYCECNSAGQNRERMAYLQ